MQAIPDKQGTQCDRYYAQKSGMGAEGLRDYDESSQYKKRGQLETARKQKVMSNFFLTQWLGFE